MRLSLYTYKEYVLFSKLNAFQALYLIFDSKHSVIVIGITKKSTQLIGYREIQIPDICFSKDLEKMKAITEENRQNMRSILRNLVASLYPVVRFVLFIKVYGDPT
ncbi:hypothetical protein TNIN_384021 [Trichonephila inaurata madagascariensis]|uniref:Uncharacterized protein n=1 Tax=Trichonephila inaurata madagascariensis TaxID=2747483 RepID=A0A8X6XVS1_9ARAC|nr:hypothetical protein TNIN_384021 [Trichonephila inaurata madagascariensis]